jgi:hypothetical protein
MNPLMWQGGAGFAVLSLESEFRFFPILHCTVRFTKKCQFLIDVHCVVTDKDNTYSTYSFENFPFAALIIQIREPAMAWNEYRNIMIWALRVRMRWNWRR